MSDDVSKMWSEDSKDVDVLCAIARRTEGIKSIDEALAYMEAAANGLPSLTLRLPNQVSNAAIAAWTGAFGRSSDRDAVKKALMQLWLDMAGRVQDAWAASTTEPEGRVYLALYDDMMVRASAFNDAGAARSTDHALQDYYSQRRADLVYKMDGYNAVGPANRTRDAALKQVWANVDANTSAADACQTDPAAMARCRDEELRRLRMYRERVEDAVGAPLHPDSRHLFDGRSFKAMQGLLGEFIGLPQDQRLLRTPSLQKHFELQGLRELQQRLLEMRDDAEAITKVVRGGLKADLFDSVLDRVENMEWACTRTWQQDFPRARKRDYRALSGWRTDTFTAYGYDRLRPMQGGAPSNTTAWGAPEAPSNATAWGAPEEVLTSATALSIAQSRQTVRDAFNALRSAIVRITLESAPLMDTNALFMRDAVFPRLKDVLVALDANVHLYLKRDLLGSPSDDRRQGERLKSLDSWQNTQLSAGDLLAYKFSDASVALMYALKFVRAVAQVGALFAAQKVFAETYVREVVVEGRDPPSLARMLLTFLSIDATVQLAVLLVLVLLSYTHSDDPRYIIDDDFLVTFLLEYFVSTSVLFVIGVLFAQLMRDKRYFDLPGQGRVVGRAFRDIMIAMCVVVGAVPFFLVL